MQNTHAGSVRAALLWQVVVACVCVPVSSLVHASEARAITALRTAIEDLTATFGPDYPNGPRYLEQLNALSTTDNPPDSEVFERLKRRALLDNPLLEVDLLLVKRRSQMLEKLRASSKPGRQSGAWPVTHLCMELGLPSNHECNSSLNRTGYDNAIVRLTGIGESVRLETVYQPDNSGYIGEIDLHPDGDRFLFTQSDATGWDVYEMRLDGSVARRVSCMPDDVDAFDACYLPDGNIVFGSTASYQAVPCWHGARHVSNLYLMNAEGEDIRQLCFDQDHNFHPCVLPNGQVLYHRWDYTGISHIFLRQLMVMNPDGTGQRAVYGSNSWYPNSLYFPRPLPGRSDRLVCILSGYHGVHRMGQLVLLDTSRGWHEAEGIVQRISGQGQAIEPKVMDNLVDEDWPKFLHPYPLSDKYFLVAGWMDMASTWGIYLADVFDNVVLVHEEPGYALLEPVPVRRTQPAPVIPERVDLNRKDAVVYLHDVYAGPGLAGVPRGTVRELRVIAYHFGYRGLAGPDKIGCGGPWEAMRILGTVPVEADGSAAFRVPANTPLAVQPLDGEGKAVQLMRSWFTAMPGEVVSCVGCHEGPNEAAVQRPATALQGAVQEIRPWYGPARGFDFAREVQPVLDRYCVACHDGSKETVVDLRPAEQVPDYQGRRLSKLGADRLDPAMKKATGGMVKYTPAYEALLPYVRRVGIEDDVSLLVPGEYHADTSELVQMLTKGHAGVVLDAESWSRIVTWIDLNAPCHGTWGDVYPVPGRADARRKELKRLYGGADDDPEVVHTAVFSDMQGQAASVARTPHVELNVKHSPAVRTPALAERVAREVELAGGVTLKLVRIGAGEFVMGDADGQADERPETVAAIERPFWMGATEVTNAQFRCFNAQHDPRYYGKRHARSDDQGLWLNAPEQPAVRVSWREAMAFCDWLSEQTGRHFTLPTEAQWEYACRAGGDETLSYGGMDDDFSAFANLADASFARALKGERQATGGLEHLMLEGAALSDVRYDDGAIVTAPVGRYRANAWGLHDMHGNAAEWTRSIYMPHPYRGDDRRNDVSAAGRRVVRGGSFFDRAARARSAFRLAYPEWQRVFNVGFRVVVEE